MMAITLIPLTKKGKQLVKQYGHRWLVMEKRNKVLFHDSIGPWLLVIPVTEEQAAAQTLREARVESASRWIHQHNDMNFKVAP